MESIEPDRCGICWEVLNEGRALHTAASDRATQHVFHETCISGWLKIKSKCPLCNRLVVDLSITADNVIERGKAVRRASEDGDEPLITALLAQGSICNHERGMALCSAAVKGYRNIVVKLREHGPVLLKDLDSALSGAAGEGYIEIVTDFLETVRIEGFSVGVALDRAAFWGHRNVVILILERALNSIPKVCIAEALGTAAQMGHYLIVEDLLVARSFSLSDRWLASLGALCEGNYRIIYLLNKTAINTIVSISIVYSCLRKWDIL